MRTGTDTHRRRRFTNGRSDPDYFGGAANTPPGTRKPCTSATPAEVPSCRRVTCPIEKAWSKLKAKLRTATKRMVDELWQLLGEVIDNLAPEDCRNSFRSCGYSPATLDRELLK